MDKYEINYMDNDGEIITMTVEASGVETLGDTMIFFDDHVKGGYVFYEKDVISYTLL